MSSLSQFNLTLLINRFFCSFTSCTSCFNSCHTRICMNLRLNILSMRNHILVSWRILEAHLHLPPLLHAVAQCHHRMVSPFLDEFAMFGTNLDVRAVSTSHLRMVRKTRRRRDVDPCLLPLLKLKSVRATVVVVTFVKRIRKPSKHTSQNQVMNLLSIPKLRMFHRASSGLYRVDLLSCQ